MTLAYVYKWTHIPSLRWYVGSRTAEGCHPEDGYICSAPKLEYMITENHSEWKREIIATGSQEDMYNLETEILQLFDARRDSRSFNRHNNDGVYVLWGDKHPNKDPINAKKISDALTGVKKTAKHIANMVKALRDLGEEHPSKMKSVRESKRKKMLDKGDKHHQKTTEARESASERVTGDKNPMYGKTPHNKGKPGKQLFSSSNGQSRSVHTPLGDFKCLVDAAKKHGVSSVTIGNRARSNDKHFEEYYYLKKEINETI